MIIKACLFDLDGVIVDTAKYHYLAWKALADKLGFKFTVEHNERLKGVSRMDSLEILLEIGQVTLTEEEKWRYAAEKNTLYVSFIEKMAPDEILPNVREFLKELRSEGVKISLGSASKNAEMILEKLDLMSAFDAIVDGRHIAQAKPDPEVFLRGAAALSEAPENCVVFEDAQAGVQAAKNAGMACVG
ncbi:MAG: beta-phosphoglucomutase, partial [Bacteroidales bacterium]|nr:beta-phosphoglucomutase [Bacteroidales bacterium]